MNFDTDIYPIDTGDKFSLQFTTGKLTILEFGKPSDPMIYSSFGNYTLKF